MQIDKGQKKNALAAQETFSHMKFSAAARARSKWSGQEGVCKARSGLQPPGWRGRRLAGVGGKDRAVRKGEKW